MDRKKLLAWGLIFVCALGSAFAAARIATAEMAVMIRVNSTAAPGEKITLTPPAVTIKKGDVVIWTNFARAAQVAINFKEGKTCQSVTEAARGFKMNEEGCFVTDFIPMGGTSSLRFTQPGTYKYELTAQGRKDVLEGQIVVE